MTGYKDNRPGTIHFDSHDGFISMIIQLVCCEGLYYCPTDVFTLGHCPGLPGCTPPIHAPLQIPVPKVQCMVNQPLPPVLCCSLQFEPTSKARQLETEIWLLWLGSTGITHLNVLPQNVTGLPATFEYHPFQFVDFKEEARVRKQVAQGSAVRAPERCPHFYMGFGFMHTSTSDYTH